METFDVPVLKWSIACYENFISHLLKKKNKIYPLNWVAEIYFVCVLYICYHFTIYASLGFLGSYSLIQFLHYSTILSYSVMETSLTSFTFCALCLLSRSSVLAFSSSRKQMYKLGNRFYNIQALYIINSSM